MAPLYSTVYSANIQCSTWRLYMVYWAPYMEPIDDTIYAEGRGANEPPVKLSQPDILGLVGLENVRTR